MLFDSSARKEILRRRLKSLELQFQTYIAYHTQLEKNGLKKAENLNEQAIQDAYLKRFASIQDYLGAKVFNLLGEVAGLPGTKMSEILEHLEKEGIISSVESWAELRAMRNDLNHDYPEEAELGLKMLERVMSKFEELKRTYTQVVQFASRYL